VSTRRRGPGGEAAAGDETAGEGLIVDTVLTKKCRNPLSLPASCGRRALLGPRGPV